MGSIIPSTQAFSLQLASQTAPLSVLSFDGREAISETYRFSIEFTCARAGLCVAEVLGKPARLAIQPAGPNAGALPEPAARVFNGIVTAFDELGPSAGGTRYRAVLEPRLSDLNLGVASRLFQNQTVPAIIEAVLRHDGHGASDYRFALRGRYERREYTTQYRETALAFIRRIAADEGIWFRFEQTAEREVLVFGDDPGAYAHDPKLSAPYCGAGGARTAGAACVVSLSEYRTRVTHKTTPAAAANSALDARDEIRHQAEWARQVIFGGKGNVTGMTPGAVFRLTNRALDNAAHGLLLTTTIHHASRSEPYTCVFTAIPADRAYRTPVDPSAGPRINGVVPARVVAADESRHAHPSAQGRFRIRLPFMLDSWSPGGTSRPVRLAAPYAGRDFGHRFPMADGTEVAVIFTDGDPERPVIIGALYDGRQQDRADIESDPGEACFTAETARGAQAELAELDRQRRFLKQRLDHLQQLMLLVSAPAGGALT